MCDLLIFLEQVEKEKEEEKQKEKGILAVSTSGPASYLSIPDTTWPRLLKLGEIYMGSEVIKHLRFTTVKIGLAV